MMSSVAIHKENDWNRISFSKTFKHIESILVGQVDSW